MQFMQNRNRSDPLEAISSLFSGNWPSEISPSIQKHLHNVYRTLAFTLLASSVGVYTHLLYNLGGMASSLACFALLFTMFQQQNQSIKYTMLMLFGLCQGLSMGPLIARVIEIDSSIILTAFASTTAMFTCFSITALYSERRSWLFMYGFLSSALSMMIIISILNMFFPNESIMVAQLYFGLLVFCGFVIVDTQMIIERADREQRDPIRDALTLFLDFVNIFTKILIILAKNKKNEKNKRSNK